MKKIIGIIFVILTTIIFSRESFAQTATPKTTITTTISPTKSPTQIPGDKQIEKIKDLVASRVAELNLVDKRGILGYVKSTTNTQVVITDNMEEEVKADIDELTKFESADNDDFGISDVKKGDLISFVGLFNKQTKRLLARFATVASNIPQNIEGVVLSKDTGEFTLNVATDTGVEKVINIETSTKTSIYEDGETTKSGFSKIATGERVIIVGFDDKTNKDQLNASRIIHFPGMKLSNTLTQAAAAKVENASPSSKPTTSN